MNKNSNIELVSLLGIGLILGIAGHALNLFIIRPAIDSNSLSKWLNLLLINLALLPSITIFVMALFKSQQAKNYLISVLVVLVLCIMGLLVWYFSYPVIHPQIGL